MPSGNFGVDSAGYATDYYDRVVQAFGPVAWWGRYLPVYSLTPAERDFLHSKGVAILPLWNNDQSGAVIGSGSVERGRAEAVLACAAWRALGLPAACVVITDVESNMFLSSQALQGWIEGCHAAGYVAGVYLNPINGTNHTAGYQDARAATVGIPCVHFTSQRELYAYQDVPQHAFIIDSNHAAAVPGYENECYFWQSWENSLGQTVDLDCASDAGLALMWGATPPPPPVKHVTVPGSLKTQASHSSSVAIDPHGKPVYLEVGATVQPTGQTAHTDDSWVEVHLVAPEAQVHGWLVAANIA